MKPLMLALSAALVAAIAIAGCGGSEPAAPAPAAKPAAAPAAPAPAPTAAPAAAAPAAAPVAAPAASTEGLDPTHAKLVNSSWQVGDFAVTFLDKEKIMVKGGPLTAIAPNGLEATYSYKEGVLEVTAMGQTKTGTWDGEKLVVDGEVAARK